MIIRVLLKDKVIAVFDNEEYAQDFIDYQATISNKIFKIERIPVAMWLIEPRDF